MSASFFFRGKGGLSDGEIAGIVIGSLLLLVLLVLGGYFAWKEYQKRQKKKKKALRKAARQTETHHHEVQGRGMGIDNDAVVEIDLQSQQSREGSSRS